MIYFKVLLQEIRTGFLNYFSYRFGVIIDLIVYLGFYFYLIFSGSGYKLTQQYSADVNAKELILTAYLFWILTTAIFSASINDIRMESVRGILQKKFMAIVPFQWLLFCMALSNVIVQFIIIFILFVISYILTGGVLITFMGIIIGSISLVGMYGLALIIGAIVLDKKKIGQLAMLINVGLLFASNVFTVTFSSSILKLIPLSYANHLIRLNYINADVQITEYILFIGINIIWCVLGVTYMNYSIKKSKASGMIDMY